MPNRDKDLQQVHSASVASVQPTKQANPVYRPIRAKNLLEARLTPRPQTYLVEIRGRAPIGVRVVASRVYDERHPLIALGRALVELRETEVACFTVEWFTVSVRQSRNL